MQEQHLLVDYENVQPSMDDLLKLAPKLTDVWLFHGPGQVKRAEQLKAAHERVTLVPHSGKGKNALDFHLSFYLGYVAAKHPDANLLVVANDKGYDSMLAHAELLGFTATRVGFKVKKVKAAKKAAKPKKATPSKSPEVAAMDAAAGSLVVAASATPQTEAKAGATKKAEPVKSPAKRWQPKRQPRRRRRSSKKEPTTPVPSKASPPAKKAGIKNATPKRRRPRQR
ncbi:MAG: PIN domain-containing protein [Burkholderiaceae bacterium]